MSEFNVSTRYAKALMELATERNTLEYVANDMALVSSTLAASKDLRTFLISPIIELNKKRNALSEIFKDKITNDTLEFIDFVLNKNRERYLMEIASRFVEIREKKMGIVRASVISAVELNDLQKDEFIKVLERYTDSKVKIDFSIDESIFGGFLVRIGDTILDASIVHQLKKLKTQLLKENGNFN